MTWGKMSLQKVFFKLILLSSELFKSHAIYSLIRCDYDNCNNYLNQYLFYSDKNVSIK